MKGAMLLALAVHAAPSIAQTPAAPAVEPADGGLRIYLAIRRDDEVREEAFDLRRLLH
jgi:hypothetical protein